MESTTVPAREGRAFRLSSGQSLKIISPHGHQAADFFAFNAADIGEWLSPSHSWVVTRHTRPKQGDVFYSRFRRAMVDFTQDGAGGVHDLMLAACDRARYEQMGHPEPHDGCAENMQAAMRALGHEIDVIPQPINFFTNTAVAADGTLAALPNPVPPGAFVQVTARMDLICVVSACPFDLPAEDWKVNADSGPTELVVEVG